MMLYICTKFCESISKDFWATDQNSSVDARVVAMYKGARFVKSAGTDVFLCTLSDDDLYLYYFSWNYHKGFQSYWANTISILQFTKGHNSEKTVI